MSKYQIWFWQNIQSPHIGSLASALADRGYKVTFVINQILSKDRLEQGWEKAKLGKANLKIANNKREIIIIPPWLFNKFYSITIKVETPESEVLP